MKIVAPRAPFRFCSLASAVVRAAAPALAQDAPATHMQDQTAILEFVAGRERDIGGEG